MGWKVETFGRDGKPQFDGRYTRTFHYKKDAAEYFRLNQSDVAVGGLRITNTNSNKVYQLWQQDGVEIVAEIQN
jgi:hypothetical protein